MHILVFLYQRPLNRRFRFIRVYIFALLEHIHQHLERCIAKVGRVAQLFEVVGKLGRDLSEEPGGEGLGFSLILSLSLGLIIEIWCQIYCPLGEES